MATSANMSEFKIQLELDGQTYVVSVTPEIIESLNSTDPAKRKGAYAVIQSAIGLQTSSSSAASTVASPQSPQSPEDMEEEEVQPTSWDEAAEKKLATIYKEIEQGKKPVKSKWKSISQKMNNKYSAEKCRLKIKSLKDRYIRIKKQNNKSGESPSDDPMEEFLGDIFDSQPDVDPDYVIDSDKVDLEEEEKKKTTCTKAKENSEGKKTKKPQRTSGSFNEVRDFLAENIERAEEAAERRHQDRMQTFNSLIDVFKASIENSKKEN